MTKRILLLAAIAAMPLAYAAWAYVLSHGAAGRVATFLYVIPVLAIGIAWLWLREVPAPVSFVGGAIALAGVCLVNLWGKPRVGSREERAAAKKLGAA